jgi:hypothetical protein
MAEKIFGLGKTGVKKNGRIRRNSKVSASGPQQSGAGRVPVNIVAKKTTKLKPMGATYGGEIGNKGATIRVRKTKSSGL